MEPLLTREEVAEFLKLSKQTVDRKIRSGEIPCVRLGTAIRVKPEQLRAYINRFVGDEYPVGESTGTVFTPALVIDNQRRG